MTMMVAGAVMSSGALGLRRRLLAAFLLSTALSPLIAAYKLHEEMTLKADKGGLTIAPKQGCSSGACEECGDNNRCRSCQKGYFVGHTSGACKLCKTKLFRCESCALKSQGNDFKCYQCAKGYVLQEVKPIAGINQQCKLCENGQVPNDARTLCVEAADKNTIGKGKNQGSSDSSGSDDGGENDSDKESSDASDSTNSGKSDGKSGSSEGKSGNKTGGASAVPTGATRILVLLALVFWAATFSR